VEQGVCVCVHYGLAKIYITKSILLAKEELWKPKSFIMQKYNLQKHPLKETQKNPSRYFKLYN
jgi:hypothetical protein